MNFTKETIDLSGLNDNQIKNKLSELNIALTPEEGKKIRYVNIQIIGDLEDYVIKLKKAS